MRFGIFKASFPGSSGPFNINFEALMNPAKASQPLIIEAANADAAVVEATSLLKLLGVSTHSILGDPTMVMNDFPNYFVGKFNDQDAEMYDTAAIAYRICTFQGINKN